MSHGLSDWQAPWDKYTTKTKHSTSPDFGPWLSFAACDNTCGKLVERQSPAKDACCLEENYDKPCSVLKSRTIILLTEVHLVKVIVFPVVMYRCENWTIKKAECQRINSFELWCWRRLLGVSWTARRSNQSILKEINPEYSLERLMLKLKLQYFGHLMWRADSLEKTMMLGKIESRRRRERQRMRWLDSITNSVDMSLSKL